MINRKVISYIVIYLLGVLNTSIAQDNSQLFENVFGNIVNETRLQLYVDKKFIGEVGVKIQGTKVLSYESRKLDKSLRTIIKDDVYQKIDIKEKWVSASSLPYHIVYDTNLLRLKLKIPTSHLKPIFYSLENNLDIKYRDEKLAPAPFAGSINYFLDKNYGSDYFGGESFSLNINSFLNLNSYVLEMDGVYIENSIPTPDSYWRRKDFSLTKDFVDSRTRLVVGDTTSRGYSFMHSKYIGGINVNKEFNIDPYTKSYSQGEREFQIVRRSKVKTYVNGSLVRDEVLPAGNYKLSRLPLVSGLNNIRLEIDEGSGNVKVLEFNIPISLTILKKGEVDYSVSHGRKIDDTGKTRSYFDDNFSSLFLQYGFTDNYSLAGFYQSEDKFSLSGISNGLSSRYGNFFLDSAYSANKRRSESGVANALSWQFQDIIGSYLKGLSLGLRYEYFINQFRYSNDNNGELLKNNILANFSIPIFNKVYINLGHGVSEYRDSTKGEKNFYRATISYNPVSYMNLSVYASRSKDAISGTVDSLSAFFTWSFVEDNQYISGQGDFENKTNRVSFTQDNSDQLYKPRYSLSADDAQSVTEVNLTSTTPVPMADLYLRASYAKEKSGPNHKQYGFGISTTSLFAYSDGFGFSQARTNTGSFAIIKTSDDLDGQDIAIRTTSIHPSSSTPLIGNPSLVDLVPYQYREVQIDPSMMELGISLEQEKFVLLPSYKSGHLVRVDSSGSRSIFGKIYRDGKPVSLEVCQLGESVFFTDRDGSFFVDGINEDINLLKVSGKEVNYIDIGKNKHGLIDLGIVNIK